MVEPKVLVITGMHRSGTSLVADYLTRCNLYTGTNLLNKDRKDKVKDSFLGHHEDLEFLDFHMEVFRKRRKDSSGLFIKNSKSISQNITKLPIKLNSSEYSQAKKLIDSRKYLAQWSWKDPRTSLFLEFWNSLISNPNYLFVFRHPLLVVDSLVRRGKDKIIAKNPLNGLQSWIIYNREILNFKKTYPDISLTYEIDDIVLSPDSFFEVVNSDFALNLKYISFESYFNKKAFHSSYSEQILFLKEKYPRIVSQAMDIYHNMQEIAK